MKHERLLIHFLNCAIEAKDPIKKVKILNSELTKQHVEQKESRLDVKADPKQGLNISDIADFLGILIEEVREIKKKIL